MAIIDVITLPMIKNIYESKKPLYYMIVPVLFYAIQPFIFYYAMRYSTVAKMNMSWDLLSGILVTSVSILILKEKLGIYSALGLVVGFIAIILFSLDDKTH